MIRSNQLAITAFFLPLLSLVSMALAQSPKAHPCLITYDEHGLIRVLSKPEGKNIPESTRKKVSEFVKIRDGLQKICQFKVDQSSQKDEDFFLAKWGSYLCEETMTVGGFYGDRIQCRFSHLVQSKRLTLAEALSIAGYTNQFYNYLNPDSEKSDDPKYQNLDVFNRVLNSALEKLSADPEYQHQGELYRGDKFHGRTFVEGHVDTFGRWMSSSCMKEVAFGPKFIPLPESEAEEIKKRWYENIIPGDPQEKISWKQLVTRDPESIPNPMNTCQKEYFAEGAPLPIEDQDNFGVDRDLAWTILPPVKGKSKGVKLYYLSQKRFEAEILFPPSTKYEIVKVTPPPPGEAKTHVLVREIAEP